MGYKSRGNYALGKDMSQDRWESIFGKKENKNTEAKIIHAKCLKDRCGFNEQPNMKDIIKIGKEINLFKRIERCKDSKIIEKRFGKEANSFFDKKVDSGLVKNITNDIMKGLRRK